MSDQLPMYPDYPYPTDQGIVTKYETLGDITMSWNGRHYEEYCQNVYRNQLGELPAKLKDLIGRPMTENDPRFVVVDFQRSGDESQFWYNGQTFRASLAVATLSDDKPFSNSPEDNYHLTLFVPVGEPTENRYRAFTAPYSSIVLDERMESHEPSQVSLSFHYDFNPRNPSQELHGTQRLKAMYCNIDDSGQGGIWTVIHDDHASWQAQYDSTGGWGSLPCVLEGYQGL